MPDTTHEGNDPMGALTTHRGPLDTCPAPDCQDRIIEQQEDDTDPVCKFDEGCHRVAPCDPGCGTPPPNQTPLRTRIAEALAREDAHNWGYDHGFVHVYGGDPETDGFVDAVLAVLPPAADRAAVLRELIAKAEEWDGHITMQELRRMAAEAQQPETEEPAPLTPCTCRQAVHALEHHGRTIPTCPWCTPAPNIRPYQPAGRTVNTVDTRLLGTKEA